jgi:L-fucose mutarotase
MLRGISPLISPELLVALYKMGHGDEIVIADAHFPGHSVHQNVIRADGLMIADLLQAILPLFVLDTYVDDPVVMMEPVKGDSVDPGVEMLYLEKIQLTHPDLKRIEKTDRFAFYDRAKSSFAVVMTGDTRKYGNIILKKGVTPEQI